MQPPPGLSISRRERPAKPALTRDGIVASAVAIMRTEGPVGYGGYGGLIDLNGVLWSARPLLRWDPSLPLTGTNGVNWTG